MASLAAGRASPAQSPAPITVVVRSAVTRAPVEFAGLIVGTDPVGRLTNSGGSITLSVPPGPVHLRVRRVGFSPADTTLVPVAGETVTILLNPLAIGLQPMVVAKGRGPRLAAECRDDPMPARQDSVIALIEQLIQNAEQYRALIEAHPVGQRFVVEDFVVKSNGTREARPRKLKSLDLEDQQILIPTAKPAYTAGAVVRGARGNDEIFVPELQDFASASFVGSHCFTYLGRTTVDSEDVIRLGMAPVKRIESEDVGGEITLRADGFAIVSSLLRTTGIPQRYRPSYDSAVVRTHYRELVPGIAVIDRIDSQSYLGPRLRERDPGVVVFGESQKLVAVSWLRGPP